MASSPRGGGVPRGEGGAAGDREGAVAEEGGGNGAPEVAAVDVVGEGGYDAGIASDSSMWEVVTGGVSSPVAGARTTATNALVPAGAAGKEETADSHLNTNVSLNIRFGCKLVSDFSLAHLRSCFRIES